MIQEKFNRNEVIFITIVVCITSLLWNYVAGKDLNWDSLNYHYYAGFSFFNDRFDQDFFAAGGQGYFNPVLYIPFYMLVSWGFSSLLIASFLAVIHSVNFIFLYLIAGELIGWKIENLKYRLFALVLGVLSAPVLHLVGSSFADLIVSGFQLSSIYIATLAGKRQKLTYWFVAALLMGSSAGLKLSGLVFCFLFAVFCVLYAIIDRRNLLKIVALSALGGVLGFTVFSAYWAVQLWQEFGNPFFPMFNGVFKSDYFLQAGWVDNRFRATDIIQAVEFPFVMVLPDIWVYEEKISPDLRFAAAFIISILSIVLGMIFNDREVGRKQKFSFGFVGIFWFSFFVWVLSSGNARYGLVLLLLVGPLIVFLSIKFLKRREVINPLLLLLVICQATILWMSTETRFSKEEWTKEWYSFDVPDDHVKNNFLFLSADGISFSFLMEKFNRNSSMVNLGGIENVPHEVSKNRIKELHEKNKGRVRGLFKYSYVAGERDAGSVAKIYQPMFSRFGYKINSKNCSHISQKKIDGSISKIILSCELVYRKEIYEQYEDGIDFADSVFNEFEKTCGNLFQVVGVSTYKGLSTFYRSYPGDAIAVWLDEKNDIYLGKTPSNAVVYLGNAEDIFKPELNSKVKRACLKLKKAI